jgi:putative phosphoesterase
MRRVGIISDTHNVLRPEAIAYLSGSDHIIHAGDICNPSVLHELGSIAPVTVVRGNNDRGSWADLLRRSEIVRVEEVHFYVIHDLGEIDIDPAAAGIQVVISGHSHRPAIFERESVLYVNPGSAGPRRFRLPVSVGEVLVRGSQAMASTTSLLSSAA